MISRTEVPFPMRFEPPTFRLGVRASNCHNRLPLFMRVHKLRIFPCFFQVPSRVAFVRVHRCSRVFADSD